MKNLLLFTALLLTACGPSYRESLEQKLAGRSKQEQRLILAHECATEVQRELAPKKPGNVVHVRHMKQVCELMTGEKVTLTLPAGQEQ